MSYKSLIPAIDLLDGKCVRLHKGRREEATFYEVDPVEQIKAYASVGIHRVHVVDLDAAFSTGNNRSVIRRMRSASSMILEVGGGVRTQADVEELLALEIDYVIVGSALVKSQREVQSWVHAYPGRIIAGIDEKDGNAYIAGWSMNAQYKTNSLVNQVCSWGVEQIIFTNIAKDGTLEGPDITRTNEITLLAQEQGASVILSGGIGSDEDVRKVFSQGEASLSGVIMGKAIYENRITLEDLLNEQHTKYKPIVIRNSDRLRKRLIYAMGNEKSYKKTLEEETLWVVHEKTGRVLPYEEVYKERFVFGAIADHLQWYEVASQNAPPFDALFVSTPAEIPSNAGKDSQPIISNDTSPHKAAVMEALWETIKTRQKNPSEGSYTTYLLKEGTQVIRKKLAEEGIEIALAQDKKELVLECSDMLYHMLVLLLAEGVSWNDVLEELEERHQQR